MHIRDCSEIVTVADFGGPIFGIKSNHGWPDRSKTWRGFTIVCLNSEKNNMYSKCINILIRTKQNTLNIAYYALLVY